MAKRYDFKLIKVPDRLLPVLGEPDPGTRMFRQYGYDDEDFRDWWEAVCTVCGKDSCVSPGGVSKFAGVSRAGVHKRLKEGRLTAFLYHQVDGTSRLTKREILSSPTPFGYIPVVEARRWAEVMGNDSRAETQEERYGDRDWIGRFLDRRKGRKPEDVKRIPRKKSK